MTPPMIWLNDGMSQQPSAQSATAIQGSAHHDDHGSTPAAWTAVVIIVLAFTLGTLALIIGSWPLFWVSVGLVVVGGIAGKVLAMMGLGKKK